VATRLLPPGFLSIAAIYFLALILATGVLSPDALALDKANTQGSAAAKPTGPKVHGYMLRQRSRAEGALEVYVSKSSVRLEIIKNGFILISAAPWREVTMYCTRTHNFYKCPFQQIRNPYLKLRNMYDGGAMTDLPLVPNGEGSICNLKTKVFVQKPGFEMTQMSRRSNNMIASRAPRRVTYQTTTALKCDPQVGFLLSRFYALPETNEVPLELTYVAVEDKNKIELETSTCKKTEIAIADFTLPTGYKQVKDALQVIVPDNKDGELDMMMFGTK
jgi:hypothetical protein